MAVLDDAKIHDHEFGVWDKALPASVVFRGGDDDARINWTRKMGCHLSSLRLLLMIVLVPVIPFPQPPCYASGPSWF